MINHSRLDLIEDAAHHQSQPMCDAVFNALRDHPKSLPCRFFYDRIGSALFEQITELPEYYLTRAEAEILSDCSDEIVRAMGTDFEIVEFGSGSSTKTRLLLSAALRERSSLNYVPIDISRDFLIQSSHELLNDYPALTITAIAAEYLDSISILPLRTKPRLILFLGSNIGNFREQEAIEFLTAISQSMAEGDRILLGADLIKDRKVLQDAYNDSAGVTAAFNLNLLGRINRDLKANFDLENFEHSAPFDQDRARIEMRLTSKARQTVFIEDLQTSFEFEAGEVIRTEWSQKYSRESLAALAKSAHLEIECVWTDQRGYFAEFLLRKVKAPNLNSPARKDEIETTLAETRARTLSLMSEAPKEFWRRRVHSFYSPIGWHFGHIGRTEEFWVCKATHREPLDPGLSFVYADLAENPKDNRVNIPEVEATLSYLERTREVALEALKASNLNLDDPFLKEGYAWEFAIQHECQHQETIAEMLCLIQKQTTLTSVAPIPWESKLVTKTIAHPSGEFLMGSDNVYGYDNEKNPHRVKVSGFGLGNYPVTAFQWSEFILEGGYQRSEIWSPEGWHWRQENHVTVPFYWTIDQGYFQIGPFGLRALHPDEPVQGISQFEAEAYARWKKMRLPSEEEWEFAASSAPDGIKRKFPWGDSEPTPASAAHSLRGWAPQPVGSVDRGKTPLGVSDMAGNIWEWTSGKFLPYPGFSAFPYDGYSKDHMEGKHFVCRGGSWATSPTILRNTFRNWYVPSYRQGFLGVRLATD